MPPYQSPVYNNNSQVPNQYSGNYAGNPHGQTDGNLQTPLMLSRNRGYAPATAGPQDISYQMPSYQPPGYNSNASPPGQYYRYGTELAPTVPYDSPQNLPAQTPSGNDRASVGGSEGPYNARPRLNDPQTRQALFEAVDSGDAALAEQLLRAGADQDMRGSSGFEPLEQTAQNADLVVVRLLFQYPWNDDLTRLLISHGALGVIPGSGEHSGNRDDQELDWWRHILVGELAGSFDYQSDSSTEPMGFQVGQVSREALSALRKGLILFSGGGEDTEAPFVVYGQVYNRINFITYLPLGILASSSSFFPY
ncbi:hypothetical protein ACHAPE_002895 [Trichoderma viride]